LAKSTPDSASLSKLWVIGYTELRYSQTGDFVYRKLPKKA